MYGATCPAGVAPDPDFGPPSFCLTLSGGATDLVQGFLYDSDGDPAPAGLYTLVSWAQTVGTTGTRSFYADQSGLIRHCTMTGAASRAVVTSNTIDTAAVNC